MDVTLRAYIKSTKVQLVTPKESEPYIEGIVTLRFPVDDSADLAQLAEMQKHGQVVAFVQSAQYAMPGVRRAVERFVDGLADAGVESATVSANGKSATIHPGKRRGRKPAEKPA